jgi:hypothetical protein
MDKFVDQYHVAGAGNLLVAGAVLKQAPSVLAGTCQVATDPAAEFEHRAVPQRELARHRQ